MLVVSVQCILKPQGALNHRLGAVPPHANISHELKRKLAAVNLLSTLEVTAASIRASDIEHDVVKLADCALFAPDLEGIVIAGLAELLLE